jgi:hypothetical protein
MRTMWSQRYIVHIGCAATGVLVGFALSVGLRYVMFIDASSTEQHTMDGYTIRQCPGMVTSPIELAGQRNQKGRPYLVCLSGNQGAPLEFQLNLLGEQGSTLPSRAGVMLFPFPDGEPASLSLDLSGSQPASVIILSDLKGRVRGPWYADGNGDGVIDTMQGSGDANLEILVGNEWLEVTNVNWKAKPPVALVLETGEDYMLDPGIGWTHNIALPKRR